MTEIPEDVIMNCPFPVKSRVEFVLEVRHMFRKADRTGLVDGYTRDDPPFVRVYWDGLLRPQLVASNYLRRVAEPPSARAEPLP